jgi:hypothetical protein
VAILSRERRSLGAYRPTQPRKYSRLKRARPTGRPHGVRQRIRLRRTHTLEQPPPSRHDSIFCRQSWHHHAERIQKGRWPSCHGAQHRCQCRSPIGRPRTSGRLLRSRGWPTTAATHGPCGSAGTAAARASLRPGHLYSSRHHRLLANRLAACGHANLQCERLASHERVGTFAAVRLPSGLGSIGCVTGWLRFTDARRSESGATAVARHRMRHLSVR